MGKRISGHVRHVYETPTLYFLTESLLSPWRGKLILEPPLKRSNEGCPWGDSTCKFWLWSTHVENIETTAYIWPGDFWEGMAFGSRCEAYYLLVPWALGGRKSEFSSGHGSMKREKKMWRGHLCREAVGGMDQWRYPRDCLSLRSTPRNPLYILFRGQYIRIRNHQHQMKWDQVRVRLRPPPPQKQTTMYVKISDTPHSVPNSEGLSLPRKKWEKERCNRTGPISWTRIVGEEKSKVSLNWFIFPFFYDS